MILNEDHLTQFNDFSGLRYGSIYPTDIDGLIEIQDKLFIFIELKYQEAKVPGLISLPELQYPKFMGYAEMGMTYHKTAYEFHPGWVLAHGDEGSMSQHAGITALNLAKKWGKNCVVGHSHRMGASTFTEAIGSHYRPITGIESGNLCNMKKMSYIRYNSANWQNGFAILEAEGKTLTPTLVPIDPKDGSFTALGRYYR